KKLMINLDSVDENNELAKHKGSISRSCTKDNKDSNNIILNIGNTFKNWDEVDDI
ncbi:25868_t:CDS:1, partial [Gigaspora rosea]